MQNAMQKEHELKKEIASWKETCEILSDQDAINSIKISLQEIEEGEEIPLSEL